MSPFFLIYKLNVQATNPIRSTCLNKKEISISRPCSQQFFSSVTTTTAKRTVCARSAATGTFILLLLLLLLLQDICFTKERFAQFNSPVCLATRFFFIISEGISAIMLPMYAFTQNFRTGYWMA